jgi:N-acetylglucosamine-6-phosphate deacetylase
MNLVVPTRALDVALTGEVLRNRRITPGRVVVKKGRIGSGRADREIALPEGWIISPGFVDLQVNGLAGAEVGDDPDQLTAIATELASHGVTAFCPTLVTSAPRAYARAATAFEKVEWPALGARSLGVHLEGPFLASARAGAHQPELLVDPEPREVARLVDLMNPVLVTLAPELPGALDAIDVIVTSGAQVALGHTEADHELASTAIEAGARLMTHALNAMRGIESREPSALVAFVNDVRTYVSLIADGEHVSPPVAALLASALGRRLILVSDATAATAAPPGRYRLGGLVVRSDGRRVTMEGRLAGSADPLSAGPPILTEAGVAVEDALSAATVAPRMFLGLPAPMRRGADADLVVLDDELVPQLTLIGGHVAYAGPRWTSDF